MLQVLGLMIYYVLVQRAPRAERSGQLLLARGWRVSVAASTAS